MIKLKHIAKIYNAKKDNAFQALTDINLEVQDGELAAIIGTSGAGKSTLLHILACIDQYDEGEYWLGDTLVKGLSDAALAHIRSDKIGLVMQDFALVDDFTVLQNVMLPLDFSKAAKKKKNHKELAHQALQAVGMDDYAEKPVTKLSGGQKQRVAIARAIVNSPELLLADEPTGALDSKTSHEIMQLFHQLHDQGITILIVTHDPRIADECDRKIQIEDGKIVSPT